MLPTFEAGVAAAMIVNKHVTHFPAAGDIVAQLLGAAPQERPFPSVRTVIGARAGQAAGAHRRGLNLIGVYGSSEIQAMVWRQNSDSNPEIRELGGGTLIAPGARVRARDTVSGELLPLGQSGELEFMVPSRMAGYVGNERATVEAFTPDGYFRSEDLGFVLNDREFVFQSRIGDALRLAGFLVNPVEIEHVLDSHPLVSSSQIVGVDGPRGLRPIAFVIMKPQAMFDEGTLIAHCRRLMAGFKVPHRVFRLDNFPVTPGANGSKVQKARLREISRELLAASSSRG